VPLLHRIPLSLNDVLNREYFHQLIPEVKSLETGLLQVKLLSIIQERAEYAFKQEIKELLLQKITFLSHKIAAEKINKKRKSVKQYRPELNEIDIDRTLEEHLGHRTPDYENIYCHEWIKQKCAYVLMLDVSNSMHQEKLAIAAIATGVFTKKLQHDLHGVITFAKETNIIKNLYERNNLQKLIDKMLLIDSGGATNIRKALVAGLELLNISKMRFNIGILVSDGRATVGGNPLEIASRYDRLHVLGISFGLRGSDSNMNSLMAQKGRGKYMNVLIFDDLPIAIKKILNSKL
jgi:Mg-chelatase subunit ChlD